MTLNYELTFKVKYKKKTFIYKCKTKYISHKLLNT